MYVKDNTLTLKGKISFKFWSLKFSVEKMSVKKYKYFISLFCICLVIINNCFLLLFSVQIKKKSTMYFEQSVCLIVRQNFTNILRK